MSQPKFVFVILVTLCQLCCTPLMAQEESSNSDPNGYFDLGLKTGSFLPNGIEGVRQLLPIWGLHLGHSVSETLGFEYDLDFANAKGVTYYLTYFSLRHDFVIGQAIPLFLLIGLDAHYYKRIDSYGEITGNLTEYDFRFSSGWHVGFGTETVIYGDLLFRTDIRMGFSPGRQLTVSLGGVYRW